MLYSIRILFILLLSVPFVSVCAQSSASDRPTYLSSAMPTSDQLAEQRYRNSLALHAKMLCSGVFVSKRNPEEVIQHDLMWREHYFHNWSKTQWTVDQEKQRVSVWAPRIDSYRATPLYVAVHTPTLGCSLLPVGAERTSFEPIDAGTGLPSAEGINWPMGDRNAEGSTANPQKMEAMLRLAFDNSRQAVPQHTRALLVLHRGRIVAEQYAPGFSRDMPLTGWSMGKSVVAALFGVFVKETGLDIDEPAPFEEWSAAGDPRARITPRHLLNMASGLKFHNPDVQNTLYFTELHDHHSVYFRGQNTESLVLNQPLLYEPGKVFQYRNTNPLALMSLIKRANRDRGRNPLTWPREALFDRIGARSFTLETDAFGNFVLSGYEYATARDWARLGLFVLQDGNWHGERLWPSAWRDTLTAPSPAEPHYGGLVWLREDLSAKAFAFGGWGNQITLIMPVQKVVIVRLGLSDQGGFEPYFTEIVRRVLDALTATE